MKQIKVKFCDGFYEEDDVFLPILKKHYDVVISDDPDYLIYGPFGREHLKYNCIKIFTTGECVVPNFNECDYATGFDDIAFGDRYLQLPLCSIMFRNGINMLDLAIKRGSDLPPVENKRFCSFVVSNANAMPQRKAMFDLLNSYKKVDSGGRYLNNVGGPVENKLLFEHEHKFCICFENESYRGYTTEKIVDAFASGAIPIYYGNPDVTAYFNTKAFVNCHEYDSLADAAAYIEKIDKDDRLYEQIISEPICDEGLPGLKELEVFLCNIFDQNIEEAQRIPHSSYAYNMERGGKTYNGRLFNICMLPYRAIRKIQRKLSK